MQQEDIQQLPYYSFQITLLTPKGTFQEYGKLFLAPSGYPRAWA